MVDPASPLLTSNAAAPVSAAREDVAAARADVQPNVPHQEMWAEMLYGLDVLRRHAGASA